MGFKQNRLKKTLAASTEELHRLWDSLPSALSAEQALQLRKQKAEVERFLEGSAPLSEKQAAVEKLRMLLMTEISFRRHFKDTVGAESFSLFLIGIEEAISPDHAANDRFSALYRDISLGEYDRVIPADRRAAVIERLSACYLLYRTAKLSNERRAAIDRLLDGVSAALEAGPTEGNVLMAIDRVTVELKHPSGKRFDEVYGETVSGTEAFLSTIDDVLPLIDTDSVKETALAEALTDVMQEIGVQVAAARAVNNVQRNNALTMSFTAMQAKRNGHANNAKLLAVRLIQLNELKRKLAYLKKAGIPLSEFDALFADASYSRILVEDYDYIVRELDSRIKTVSQTVTVDDGIYQATDFHVTPSDDMPLYEVNAELEGILESLEKAQILGEDAKLPSAPRVACS